MCGIVGAASPRNIVPVLVEGLKRLEYRGYDSCGIAVHQGGALKRSRPAPRPAPAAALSRIERWEMAGMAPRIGSDSSHLPSLGEPAFENAQVSGLLVLVEPVAAGLARLSAAARTPESVSATVVQVSHACSRGRPEQPWRG